MLSSVLLHVVAAAFGIDAAMHRGACQRQPRRRFQVVDDPAVFGVRNFGDSQPLGPAVATVDRQPSRVVNLPAAGGIERSFPQDESRTRLLGRGRCNGLDHGVEFMDFRAVVVKTLGHDENSAAGR